MEYSSRSLDLRDVRGDDVNFYLAGKVIDNDSKKNRAFTISQSFFYCVREVVLYLQVIMRKPRNNGVGYIIDLAEITVLSGF